MLLFDRTFSGVRCAVWHVTESLEQLIDLLPRGRECIEVARRKFTAESRIKEWIAVRVLLHEMIGDGHEVAYRDSGAPYLKDEDTCVSISHTKEYVCVALSDTCDVGVDVEFVSPKVERVRSRFVHETESVETLTGLLLVWSAKESVYKLLHKDGVDFKEHLRVCGSLPENDAEGEFAVDYDGDVHLECLVDFMVLDEFVLTMAYYK